MSSGYPQTRHEMRRAKYTLVEVRACIQCRATVEKWRTTRGKEITLDPGTESQQAVLHRNTCKVALAKAAKREEASQPLYRFAQQQRAAAVILVHNNGSFDFVVDQIIPADPADMHNTLTEAASTVSSYLSNLLNQEA